MGPPGLEPGINSVFNTILLMFNKAVHVNELSYAAQAATKKDRFFA